MNLDSRKLLAAIVGQRMDMGETEWFFNPAPFLKEGKRYRPKASVSAETEKQGIAERGKMEEIARPFKDVETCELLTGHGSLDELHASVRECRRCPLCEKRKHFVFGSGNPKADIMFIGEAPGSDEDLQGLPFVGRAGRLLTKMIESIKQNREDVYITNVLKCRPPGNRDPQPAEIEKCEPILLRQIELIRPKIICALGRISGQTLLRTNATLGALRGKAHEYHGVKLIVTYHPAALLRNPQWKRPTWEDLKFLRREYDGVEL